MLMKLVNNIYLKTITLYDLLVKPLCVFISHCYTQDITCHRSTTLELMNRYQLTESHNIIMSAYQSHCGHYQMASDDIIKIMR